MHASPSARLKTMLLVWHGPAVIPYKADRAPIDRHACPVHKTYT
jgi:hypothetical protein